MKKTAYCILSIAVMAWCAGCRNGTGPEKPGIDNIKFSESSKSLSVGDIVTIGMSVMPLEAKNLGKVEYAVSQPGIIEIKAGSSNDGVIIEGKNRGTVVLTGKAGGFVDYCSITVSGSDERVIPHIISPVSVLEVPLRERRSVTVSLAGGSPVDNSGFAWSYTNQNIIQFESTGNVAVFDTLEPGSSVITVRHPKAQYPIDLLVYVLGSGEVPIYITSSSNVINLKKDAGNYEFQVELAGGLAEENGRFVYQIIEGSGYIALNGNGRFGTITPKAAGLALVRVTHPKAQFPFDIQVVVSEEPEYRYIDVNKTLLLLKEGENAVIESKLAGDVPDDAPDKYSFTLSESGVIQVSRSQGLFFVNAVKHGKAIISIANTYADFNREILVVVNNPVEGVIDNQKYIYTSQNVITMEAGGSDSILKMMLVGGNEADKNSFVWTVDDASIIGANTAHGTVDEKYRSMYRALYNDVPFEQFEAQALITPKKTGTAKITLTHPKSKNEATVLVKVYPKGTFAGVPAVLDGQPYYRVERGKSLEMELTVQSGDPNNIGSLQWSVSNTDIAGVDHTGLSGVIRGLKNGITTLTVSGGNLKHPFSAVIIVNIASELDNQKFIYVLNPFMTMTVGQSVITGILSCNMDGDEVKTISYINNDSDVVAVHSIGSQMVLTAQKAGSAQILVKGSGTNEIKIMVTVEEPKVSAEQPFYLTTDKDIIGIVKNETADIDVTLIGGSALKYESSIIWSVENSQTARLTGNGTQAKVTGITEGQTVVNISHPKSSNQLRIVVFVVANTADLNNKVALYVEKNNYLIERGERIYIPLKTNASDAQKAGIQWNIENADITGFDVSSDNMAVFITGLKPGTTQISISHSQNITPQIIYVSVVSQKQGLKYISVPSIVETVAGNNYTIKANTQNLDSVDMREITWKGDNQTIAAVSGNGDSCLVQAKLNGCVNIIVEQKEIGFLQNIIVYVYSGYEEMASSYVMGAAQSYYRMGVGDVIDVSLLFGAKGFPEHALVNIRWSASGNNVVSVAGEGKKAGVRALNPGIAHVYAESDTANNRKVTIEIEVTENVALNSGYRFDIAAADRIKGVVNGSFADILVKIYNGTTEVFTGLNKMEFEAEDSSVIGLTVIDNNVRVMAKKTGQSYITIKHPQVPEYGRILIYTASSQNELDSAYPLAFEKTNYLLKKGDMVRIKTETPDNDEIKLNKIRFTVEGAGVIAISEISKREITVSALEKGNDVILVRYDNAVVQRIYVSVTTTVDSDLSAYLVTENIIGIVVGSVYETRVSTNLPGYLQGSIYWVSDDSDTVSIESYDGIYADLKGNKVGKTYVTVKAGNTERKILVFVCANDQELKNYQAINIDQRYFVMNTGQSMALNLFSYQGTVQGTTVYGDYYTSGGNFGNVIELTNKTARSVTVSGRHEGIAGIRITNSYYNAEIIVYVEVRSDGTGSVSGVTAGNYMTAVQTLYVIEPSEINVNISVDVIGDGFFQSGYFVWEGYDSGIIEVKAQGKQAYVNPKKTGQTVITVSNIYCDNILPITIIVGNRYTEESGNLPYIYTADTIYEMNIKDVTKIIYYEVRNMPEFTNLELVEIQGSSVNINYGNAGRITATPVQTGMTHVKIYAKGNVYIDFYFIVRENDLNETIYLTTIENFVIGSVNEIKAVDIRLMGYDEVDSTQYKWSIDKKNVAQVIGNGNRGQIYPVAEGDAVITVTHYKAKFPLTINVRVTRNTVAANLVYLTTQNNVIEALVGEENYIYVQKIGGKENLNSCTWTVDDPGIVSISGNEYAGIYKIKKAGVARINITNVEAVHPLQIVVVAKEKTGSPLYITASESLIEMMPGQTGKRVSVQLAGGNESDKQRFNWSVYYQSPVDAKIAMSGGNVVTLVANADQCNITAVNEGVARIRVSHVKADNPLYITVQVSKYKQIEFPYNQKQMSVGDSEFIRINVPNYENFKDKVQFVSDNPEVCTMVGTSSTALLTAHGKGYAIVKAKIEGKDQVAELYVTVVQEEDPDTNRIVTGKTSYAFHPRSSPITVSAQVFGLSFNDSDNDNIWWELVNLDNSDDPVLDIYPVQATNKERGSREVQISPRREGEAQIVIGHKYVHPKYYKTISVIVAEVNNALTLDKNMVKLTMGQTQMLKATIIGAKTKDYDDIQWITEYKLMFDGTRQEVVRVMGSGQDVMLYPMSDGTVEVQARYKGLFAVCTVTVESQYVFSMGAQSVRMYPGQVVDIPFEIRPVDSIITWYSNEYGVSDPVVQYEGMQGQKILRLTAKKEGSAQISGIANSRRAAVNVYVAYNYKVLATAYAQFTPILDYNDKPTVLTYMVYPPNTALEAVIPPAIQDAVIIEIMKPDKETGEGEIYISARREIEQTDIKWKQVKPDGASYTGKEAVTTIKVAYDPKERITPYFVRYYGAWTNADTEGDANPRPKQQQPYTKNGQILGEMVRRKNGASAGIDDYEFDLGDGEEHYIIFDKIYPNSFVEFNVQLNNAPPGVAIEQVDIVHNGQTVRAIRLSGGKDYVVYDRVMFNKRLYIDVETNFPGTGAGSGSTTQTFQQWHDENAFNWQTGWQEKTLNLWNRYENYFYQQEDWYFYYPSQINLNPGYVCDNEYVKISDIPDAAPTAGGFEYASKSAYLTFVNELTGDTSQQPGTSGTLYYQRKGYYYTQGTINQYATTSEPLFSTIIYEQPLNYQGPDKISLTPVIFRDRDPVYKMVTLYSYSRSYADNKVSFENALNISEDQYGNKARLHTFMSGLTGLTVAEMMNPPVGSGEEKERDEDDDTGVDYYSVFSLKPYSEIYEVSVPSALADDSTWDVFHETNTEHWSKGWRINHGGIKRSVYIKEKILYRSINALYFQYTGLKNDTNIYALDPSGKPVIKVPTGSIIEGQNQITGYPCDKYYFYAENDHYTTPNREYTANKTHLEANLPPYVNGNTNRSNIFGSYNGTYGSLYVNQGEQQARTPGSDTTFTIQNGIIQARQRYRWEDWPYNCIVPISRMLKFPIWYKHSSTGLEKEWNNAYALKNYDNHKKMVNNTKPYTVDWDQAATPALDYKVPLCATSSTDKSTMTSTPMPSINTRTIAATNGTTQYQFNVLYKCVGDKDWSSMKFTVNYKKRKCHALYEGTAGDDTTANTTNKKEVPGITAWGALKEVSTGVFEEK